MKKLYMIFCLTVLICCFNKTNAQIIYTSFAHGDIWYSHNVDLDFKNPNPIPHSWTLQATSYDQTDTGLHSHVIRIITHTNCEVLCDTVTAGGSRYPRVLNLNDSINDNQAVWLAPQPNWFYIVKRGDGGRPNYGNWFNVGTKFLALREKYQGDFYYGWVRLTVSGDTGATTAANKIVDQAYNSQAYSPILAGQMPVAGINDYSLICHVFTYDKKIIVNSGNIVPGTIIISNSIGQTLITSMKNNSHTEFDLNNYNTGIYYITVISNDHTWNKKVFLR